MAHPANVLGGLNIAGNDAGVIDFPLLWNFMSK